MIPRISYSEELSRIAESYERIQRWDADELRSVLLCAASGPALFVGTGGTLAVARFAAGLHERVSGQPARAITPLELSRLSPMTRASAVLFSAGLKHPDALLVLNLFTSGRLRPATVVTLRDPDEVRGLSSTDVQIIGLPPMEFKEGFLATTSVLQMFCALIRSYLGDPALPERMPQPDVELPTDAERILVLSTPDLASIAVDIETRCHELGVASVQSTDFRNFAHGRHVGLERNASSTRVLALVADPFVKLAEATLNVLSQEEIKVTAWRSDRNGTTSILEFLLASMHLVGALADSQGVNPSRPHVPPFGRRLYHLGLTRAIPQIEDGPVDRKLVALAAGSAGGEARSMYEHALSQWLANVGPIRFSGLVLDYDGTVCATGRRTEIPDSELQAHLLRLLDRGIRIGIASGRGKSLHEDFRKWVPRRHWDHLLIGLYNGGTTLRLADDLPDMSAPSPMMNQVVERLTELPLASSLAVEARECQVTATVRPGAFAHPTRLRALIAAAMTRYPALPVKVVSSGHSVDIVPATSNKRVVADLLCATDDLPLMAFGDQGDIDGNDFELLASTPWSLTVDRCSADPTRCWYLDERGRAGPALLSAYLDAIYVEAGGFFFRSPG